MVFSLGTDWAKREADERTETIIMQADLIIAVSVVFIN
jgi:hypothetical protein